ncbi:hypothetical protein [Streptomyces muensis]|uniref:hypothetical protein n=1 Tax=Streptomyces muensis TaxID=1077944 RepID=UPI0027E3B294|nr:hypothetical protein [Streptomyces muensis]
MQSLRQASVAAEVPLLMTVGLGQARKEAAYGADPAVLLKVLAPRDSEQHPPRVLLLEERTEVVIALTSMLERRGMQVARALHTDDAVTLSGQMRPNLVVMGLKTTAIRRRTGLVDALRCTGQLGHTPSAVYTAADMSQADRDLLVAGKHVLFLAERSTSADVQSRILEVLVRISSG